MSKEYGRRRFLETFAAASLTSFAPSILLPGTEVHAVAAPAVLIKKAPEFNPASKIGINIDPQVLDCSTDFLKQLGVSWVRFAIKSNHDYTTYLSELARESITAVAVIEKESIKINRWDENRLFDKDHLDFVADYYAKRYPLEILQVGNEPDDNIGFSSWKTEKPDYNKLLTSFRGAFPDSFLIAGGLSSGKPEYLDGLDLSLVNAVAVHPYGVSTPDFTSSTDHTDAGSAFSRYWEKTHLPILVSEAGVNHADYTPVRAAAYLRSLLEFYKTAGVLGVGLFCLSDLMVADHGIFDKSGNPKESLTAFLKASWGEGKVPEGILRLNSPIRSLPESPNQDANSEVKPSSATLVESTP